jgi:hypothetical protein
MRFAGEAAAGVRGEPVGATAQHPADPVERVVAVPSAA